MSLLKEWTQDQFAKADSQILAFIKSSALKIGESLVDLKYMPKCKTFDDIDTILGLVYTSSGIYASYCICNTYLFIDVENKLCIVDFMMDENEEMYCSTYFEDENETIIKLSMSNKQEVLQNCTVEGLVVKLPFGQLSRELYMEVKQSLELIGGKWTSGKVQGFVFKADPTDLLKQIASGENRNLKKEFQFFGTPDDLAEELVRDAEIKKGDEILEPSAGQGAIIDAILRETKTNYIFYIENMPTNTLILNKKYVNEGSVYRIASLNDDFLTINSESRFDKIIANPPFAKNADIDHIRKMYEVCRPGGKIVTLASRHWLNSDNKKEKAFREWLEDLGAFIIEIEAGRFKESGTNIAVLKIIINKGLDMMVSPECNTHQTSKQQTLF